MYNVKNDNAITDKDIFNITENYESCSFICSGTGILKDSVIYRTLNFRVESLNELIKIIKETNNQIYIDFVRYDDGNGNFTDIYRSKYCLQEITSECLAKYNASIEQFTWEQSNLHKLCMAVETNNM